MTENVKCSLSFLSVNKILFLSSKTVLKSTHHLQGRFFLVLFNRPAMERGWERFTFVFAKFEKSGELDVSLLGNLPHKSIGGDKASIYRGTSPRLADGTAAKKAFPAYIFNEPLTEQRRR